jgi:hypothetical protein
MSTMITDNPAQELQRLSSTGFFIDKPADQSKGDYLAAIALREGQQFGLEDALANHYLDIAVYARSVGV